MSIAAAALALDREFTFEDGSGERTVTLRPLAYEDLARFSLWCEDRSRAGLFRASETDGVDPKQLLSAHLVNVTAGEYEPGGETFSRTTRSDAGGRKIIELMLAPDDKDAVWDIYADVDVFRKCLALAAEINADPKAIAARRRPTTGRQEAPSR